MGIFQRVKMLESKSKAIIMILLSCKFIGLTWAGEVDYYAPQNILKFADYLYNEKDYLRAAGEYQRYLFYSQGDVDSTLYKIALCYRLNGKMEKSIAVFQRILKEYPKSDKSLGGKVAVSRKASGFIGVSEGKGNISISASYQIGYSYFLMGRHGDSVAHLKGAIKGIENENEVWKFRRLVGLNYLQQKRWDEANRLFSSLALMNVDENSKTATINLRRYAEEGKHLPRKNRFLAGSFSAILPGSGKVYTGRAYDGLYSFVLLGLTGWLTYDGFRRGGVNSIKGWSFGMLSGVFYLGNVYGSVLSARIYNRRVEDKFLERVFVEDIHDYR